MMSLGVLLQALPAPAEILTWGNLLTMIIAAIGGALGYSARSRASDFSVGERLRDELDRRLAACEKEAAECRDGRKLDEARMDEMQHEINSLRREVDLLTDTAGRDYGVDGEQEVGA